MEKMDKVITMGIVSGLVGLTMGLFGGVMFNKNPAEIRLLNQNKCHVEALVLTWLNKSSGLEYIYLPYKDGSYRPLDFVKAEKKEEVEKAYREQEKKYLEIFQKKEE